MWGGGGEFFQPSLRHHQVFTGQLLKAEEPGFVILCMSLYFYLSEPQLSDLENGITDHCCPHRVVRIE